MHPILANPRWLSLYVLGWLPVGVVLAAGLGRDVGWVTAATFVVPLILVHSFFGLSSWYVCRAFPIKGGLATWRAALTHLAAATMTSAVWVAIAGPWASGLDSFFDGSRATQLFLEQRPMLALVGGLLFLVAASLHYLLMAFQDMQTAQRQAIELQLLARDAELKALRTQIDPHFLFNSLHSISALTSSDPLTARRMCILLADFLRDTLRLGASTSISLADELSLVERYLNIQRVRLGPRLEVTVDAEPGATACRIPPLLLQPVVENAIVHGVTHLIEGGAVRISAVRHEKILRISVTNPCDAARPKSTGTGLGLELLTSRLHAEFGSEARAHAVETHGQFEVTIEMPAVTNDTIRTVTEHTADTLRVVIVDDEELARQVLVELLAAHQDVEVVAECADGFEAVRAVSTHRPDLILLDIQMPKLDGFEVLELLGEDVPVIFVTAYDQHAIRAFDVHAVDYLLKPFDADRLSDALVRARERIGRSEGLPVRDIVSSGRADASKPIQRILIRDRADVHIIPVDQVDYIEAQDDYVAVRAGGESRLKEQTLTDLEQTLDPTCFVRIHRRFLLQVDRLARIEMTATNSRIAVLTDGSRLPISRTGYRRLSDLIDR